MLTGRGRKRQGLNRTNSVIIKQTIIKLLNNLTKDRQKKAGIRQKKTANR